MSTLSASARTRSIGLSQRLLAGEGAASVHAYRAGSVLRCVAHSTLNGHLLIAANTAGTDLAEAPEGAVTDARIDITLQAPLAEAAIVVASAHMLGHLHWLCPCQTEATLPHLPGSLTAVLSREQGRLAAMVADRVLVHDHLGTASVPFATAVEQPPPPIVDPFVTAVDQDSIRSLCWDIMTGAVDGDWTITPQPVGEQLAQRAFVLDAGAHGTTLVHTTEDSLLTAFLPASKQGMPHPSA